MMEKYFLKYSFSIVWRWYFFRYFCEEYLSIFYKKISNRKLFSSIIHNLSLVLYKKNGKYEFFFYFFSTLALYKGKKSIAFSLLYGFFIFWCEYSVKRSHFYLTLSQDSIIFLA